MCDTEGHEHWCNGCGRELKFEDKTTFKEVEWSINADGVVKGGKSMFCQDCLKDMSRVQELDKFFTDLGYKPYGAIFCSICKTDLTKKFKNPIVNEDYELITIKQHTKEMVSTKYQSEPLHLIKTIVICKDCIKTGTYADKIEELKRLGRNPKFEPTIVCPKAPSCRQYQKGDIKVNCRHIGIGRDQTNLDGFSVICVRKHKGSQPLPFDDGLNITRPGAANPGIPAIPVFGSHPVGPGSSKKSKGKKLTTTSAALAGFSTGMGALGPLPFFIQQLIPMVVKAAGNIKPFKIEVSHHLSPDTKKILGKISKQLGR